MTRSKAPIPENNPRGRGPAPDPLKNTSHFRQQSPLFSIFGTPFSRRPQTGNSRALFVSLSCSRPLSVTRAFRSPSSVIAISPYPGSPLSSCQTLFSYKKMKVTETRHKDDLRAFSAPHAILFQSPPSPSFAENTPLHFPFSLRQGRRTSPLPVLQ